MAFMTPSSNFSASMRPQLPGRTQKPPTIKVYCVVITQVLLEVKHLKALIEQESVSRDNS